MKKGAFGAMVKRQRLKLGLSGGEAAERCGISKQLLQQIEGGQSPSVERADQICRGLGISLVLGTLDKKQRIDVS